jgi:exodeoxyribonuclease III
MLFTIATWNVNSLRVRLSHVLEWLAAYPVDVLAIQETRLLDADFPIAEMNQAGYQVVYSGQKAFNGVAILSRQPLSDVIMDVRGFSDPQRRLLAATVENVRIINLYVPNGESVISDKYQYKLEWLKNIQNYIKDELQKHAQLIVLGDFNIAPEDQDVHDPKQCQGQVLVSDLERTAFQQMIQLGLKDCLRLHPQPDKSFSWWDYRMNAFKRNQGLRIDHILVNQTWSTQCVRCFIDKTPRAWERPSDHAPVIAEFLRCF